MFSKKTSRKNVSVVHETKHTVIEINGERIDIDGLEGDVDLIRLLQSQGIDLDLIPEAMLSEISNAVTKTTNRPTIDSRVKVDCASCNRTVAYGKGSCLYCGNALELPQAVDNEQSVNEVDAKYLDKSKIEKKSDSSIAQSDLNYIDRLKDI